VRTLRQASSPRQGIEPGDPRRRASRGELTGAIRNAFLAPVLTSASCADGENRMWTGNLWPDIRCEKKVALAVFAELQVSRKTGQRLLRFGSQRISLRHPAGFAELELVLAAATAGRLTRVPGAPRASGVNRFPHSQERGARSFLIMGGAYVPDMKIEVKNGGKKTTENTAREKFLRAKSFRSNLQDLPSPLTTGLYNSRPRIGGRS